MLFMIGWQKMRTLAFDVDDVILDLVTNWIKIYNRDYNDNAKVKDVTNWDIGRVVKPEAKQAIYEYSNHGEIYRTAQPMAGALEGIERLRKNDFRIIYVTASNPENVKFEWLTNYGFLDDKKNFVSAYDKSLIIADYLVDDKYENVLEFKGKGILFNRPWNKSHVFLNRVANWDDIANQFQSGKLFR